MTYACSFPAPKPHKDGDALEECAERLAARYWPRFGGHMVEPFFAPCSNTICATLSDDCPHDLCLVSNYPADRAPDGTPRVFLNIPYVRQVVARRTLKDWFALPYRVGN